MESSSRKISEILVELLCHVTFSPNGGHDPEDTSQLEAYCWQELIHELAPSEKAAIKAVMKLKISSLQSNLNHAKENETQIATLNAYLNDELN